MNNQQDKIPQDSSRTGQATFSNKNQQDQSKQFAQGEQQNGNETENVGMSEHSSTEYEQDEEKQADL